MKTNKLTSAVRLAVGIGAVSATMPFAVTAIAQEEQIIEEVLITGSRIRRPDLEAVSPFTSIGAEEFKLSGVINVEQKLSELPSTLPSFGSGSNNPGDGTARVDLRGLGTSRTLVLVNGRRWIPATQTGVVDLNSIPGSLIKRVDVVTGGASAVYGSDALAGVVNFQMIDDFEGVEIGGLYDVTSENDAEKYNIDITMGGNFADGRGNAVIYAAYSKREALFAGDRSFSKVALTDTTDATTGKPILLPGGSSGVPGTRVFGGPTLANGQTLGTFGPNGEGQPWIEPDSRFNYAPDNYLQLPQERYMVNAFAHYDVNEHARVYTELAFSRNEVPQELAPTPAFTTVEINPNSAFFAPDVQDAFNANTEANGGNEYFVGRRMVENGSRQAQDVREAFRILIGMDGAINDNWSYDAYFSRAILDSQQSLNNDVSTSRFIQGVLTNDAGTACQDPSGGCVPINIFGEGNISQAAVDFVNIGATNITNIQQDVFQATVSGDLFTIPSADYPVAVVLGFEQREDRSTYRPDTFLATGDVLGFNAGEGTKGGYDVDEFFGEVSIPLLSDAPLAEDLTLWGAYRYSDYSNIGDLDSFATAINWSPIESLKFRVGYQEAVRAPNVSELFQGQSNGFPSATDPCSSGGITSDTDVATCVATGLSPAQVGNFAQANSQIEGTFGGNPDLSEETSETFTVGFVWEPTDSLDISLDYYDITIDDYITVLGGSVTNVLDLCYNEIKDIGSDFCQAIERRSDGNVSNANVLNANIGKIETSGVDLNVYYATDFGFGLGGNGSTLNIAFNGTYLDTFDVTPVADLSNRVDVCAGSFGNTCGSPLPEIQWNTRATWMTGNWTFSGLLRYIGESDDDRIENTASKSNELAAPTLDDLFYVDLTMAYAFEQGINVSVGATNIFDEEPNKLGSIAEQSNTFPSTYPLFGPRVFVSASYKF